MKRFCESSSTEEEIIPDKKSRSAIVLPSDLSTINLEGIQIENPGLDFQGEEICVMSEISSKQNVSTTSETNLGLLIEYMDITAPLTMLRSLLEAKTNMNLSSYKFFLQDTQELDASKNLVNQCVQGEGLVQINVEILQKDDNKKINIVDVLKPAEECSLSPEMNQESSDLQKVVLPAADDSHLVTRWTVAPEFRKLQEKFKMPNDPSLWSMGDVKHWIEWASEHFNILDIDLRDWNFSGKQLMSLTHENFSKKVPFDPGDMFWTHLELLRKFKIVAVIQHSSSGSSSESANNLQKNIILKSRSRTTKIGCPKIAYDGCPGAGNNGQIQLWQFLLELLTDKDHRDYIQWVGNEGEFKLINPEMVAQLWGQRKNKPTMNYEKLSRALRYYYDGEMIAKVHGKRFVYKFVCDLKSLLGYSAFELNRLVSESDARRTERFPHNLKVYSSISSSS